MTANDAVGWLAVPALAISGAAFGYTWWIDRRNILLKIHEQFLERDNQRGRRLVFQTAEANGWTRLGEDDRVLINRALAMFDVLGFYVAKRYVNPRDAHMLWGERVVRLWDAATPYIEDRVAQEQLPLWPHFRRFADDARRRLGQS